MQPALVEGLPDFGKNRFIYARYVLLQTYLTLRQHDALKLPTQTVDLVESVYGDKQNASVDDV